MNLAFKLLVSIFCIVWLSKEVVLPASAAIVLSTKFMDQTIACDHAMEAHWYGEDDTVSNLSADIQLLDCHDYDETRKLLLMAGLPEVYLSWLGLRALQIHQRPATEMTDAHKFVEK